MITWILDRAGKCAFEVVSAAGSRFLDLNTMELYESQKAFVLTPNQKDLLDNISRKAQDDGWRLSECEFPMCDTQTKYGGLYSKLT